jgi:hypothetical protein
MVVKDDMRQVRSSFSHVVKKGKGKEEETKTKNSARERPKPSLGFEGILDLDFQSLQQSKTPNNIRSVIREINFIRGSV